jgi:hypothetical protein
MRKGRIASVVFKSSRNIELIHGCVNIFNRFETKEDRQHHAQHMGSHGKRKVSNCHPVLPILKLIAMQFVLSLNLLHRFIQGGDYKRNRNTKDLNVV